MVCHTHWFRCHTLFRARCWRTSRHRSEASQRPLRSCQMFFSATRFARSRLGASLAAGAAAATMVHSASDERKRKSRCSAAAASGESAKVEVVGELEKQKEHPLHGAGKRSRAARQVTNDVSGTAAQRAFFTKEMAVMGLPIRASEAVADSALVSHRPRRHTPPHAATRRPCRHTPPTLPTQPTQPTHVFALGPTERMTRGAVRGGRPHLAHAERAARGSAGAARAVRGVVSQPPASPRPHGRFAHPPRPRPATPPDCAAGMAWHGSVHPGVAVCTSSASTRARPTCLSTGT